VSYVIVPVNATLETALFRKFDITKHPEFLTYDKILFLDCDILVIQDVMKLFKNIKVNKDKLHVAQEGSLKEPYWRLNAFAQNISTMILQDKQSFNSGEFIFKPSANMKRHFEQAKEFGLTKSHTKFYDQPVFNYYFNKHNLVVMCPYLSKKLQLFPDPSKQYHNKILLHFTGIGRYEEKAPMMKRYLAEFILSQNH
jgi:lipopolysaccharide biosynthesis glycosyltransferase